MVIYFSGTGNSRYVAESVANLTCDSAACANGDIKWSKAGNFTSEKPYVFVCPTYAWRLPRIFCEYIEKSAFAGSGRAYFVMTCGDGIGNAGAYIKKLCEKKGFSLMGVSPVIMPENYVAMFRVPDGESAERTISAAEGKIRDIAARISKGEPLPEEKVWPAGRLQSAVFNPVFYRLFVSAKGFYATDKCVSCGKCAELCPENNITVKIKPVWGGNCTHCMACICACPEEAIEYRKISRANNRFFNTKPAQAK